MNFIDNDSDSDYSNSQGLTDSSSDNSQPIELEVSGMYEGLHISKHTADINYEMAGELVPEEKSTIIRENYPQVFSAQSRLALQSVLDEIQLGFELSAFQEIAVNGLLNGLDLLLIVPTGSGKMLVVYLYALALRKIPGLQNSVVVVGLPLTSIMTDQLRNVICPVAILSMEGKFTSSGSYEAVGDTQLSTPMDNILAGYIPIIYCHPESMVSKIGQTLFKQLKRLNMLRGLILDEFHQGQQGHWETFRPDMVDKVMRQQVWLVKGSPVAAMTATATPGEVEEMIKSMGRKKRPLILSEGPIQSHFKVFIIRRPSSQCPLMGVENAKGEFMCGLLMLLRRLVLDKLVAAIRGNNPFKTTIIFFRTQVQAGMVHSWLARETGFRLCDDAPFVQNHSSIPASDDAVIAARSDKILCWLTTNRMLLGRDIPGVKIVIMVRPPDMIHSVVQAMGRAGRRDQTAPGMRAVSIFYLLFNSQDIGSNMKGMSEEVRRLCVGKECSIKLLRGEFFGENRSEVKKNNVRCCGNCIEKGFEE